MSKRHETPIEFSQLCSILRDLFLAEPTIDDFEWKARARDRMAELDFAEPPADMVVRAMGSVEYALRKTVGPRPSRPVPLPETSHGHVVSPPPAEKWTRQPAGWEIVTALMAKLRPSLNSGPSSPVPSGPRKTLDLTEMVALNEFWRAAHEEFALNRVPLLRAFAEIAIVRPADWNPSVIRANAHEHNLKADGCFGCRQQKTKLGWHHVIQIQHGGSNYLRNRVAICESCHAAIHPWLPEPPPPGWTQLGDCAPAEIKKLREEAS